ncbi:MAG: hypothetical protein Q9160_003165 [Pyrenula sp. 1 TL-2023]
MTTHTFFFYGTLMHPPVLHRVIHANPSPPPSLQALHTFSPAILHNYRRRRVRHADYPGLTAHEGSSVRGAYVTGLRNEDVRLLDVFEGGQYKRVKVRVEVLGGKGKGDEGGAEALTYLFTAGEAELEEGEWDFEEFRREKARYWSGGGFRWHDDGFEGMCRLTPYACCVVLADRLPIDADEAREEVRLENEKDPTGGRGANGQISRELEEQRIRQ